MLKRIKIIMILLIGVLFLAGCNDKILMDPQSLNRTKYDGSIEVIDASIDTNILNKEEINLIKKAQERQLNSEREYYILSEPDFRNTKWSFNELEVKNFEKGLLLIDFKEYNDLNNNVFDLKNNENILLFSDKIDNIFIEIYYYFIDGNIEKVILKPITNNLISDYKKILKVLNNKNNTFLSFDDSFKFINSEKDNLINKKSNLEILNAIENNHLFLYNKWEQKNTKTELILQVFNNEPNIIIEFNEI